MNSNDENFWLALNSYTYCEIKSNKALIYNTYSKEYMLTDDADILSILNRILISKRQGILISSKETNEIPMQNFIKLMRSHHMGGCYHINSGQRQPIALKKEMFFEKNFLNYSGGTDFAHYHTKDLFNELIQANIYLSTDCNENCTICNMAARQTLFCFSKTPSATMPIKMFNELISILGHIDCSINLISGSPSTNPDYNDMISTISDFSPRTFVLHINSKNISKFCETVEVAIPKNLVLSILFNNVDEYKNFIIPESLLKNDIKNKVLVFSRCDVLEIEQFNASNLTIIPIFDGNNFTFFETDVYLEDTDIQNQDISIDTIVLNKKINAKNYGTIDVFPDGTVKANFNNSPLGNLSEGLENLLWKEMKRTDGWMKTRTEKPCSDCVFQYLCPPPSNYEIVIGKPNLCTVKP